VHVKSVSVLMNYDEEQIQGNRSGFMHLVSQIQQHSSFSLKLEDRMKLNLMISYDSNL